MLQPSTDAAVSLSTLSHLHVNLEKRTQRENVTVLPSQVVSVVLSSDDSDFSALCCFLVSNAWSAMFVSETNH
jgi:hypothetical protein